MEIALPPCPRCASSYTYALDPLLVCPECGHEWSLEEGQEPGRAPVKDAVGNVLADGDTVTVIKDLKVKGAGGGVVKVGTRVKNIRLVDRVGDHDLDCKVDGFGPMQLKSSVVKKV